MTDKASSGRIAFKRKDASEITTTEPGEINLDLNKGVSGLTLISTEGLVKTQTPKNPVEINVQESNVSADIPNGTYSMETTVTRYNKDGESIEIVNDSPRPFSLLPLTTPSKQVISDDTAIDINMGDYRGVESNPPATALGNFSSKYETFDVSSDGLWFVAAKHEKYTATQWNISIFVFYRETITSGWNILLNTTTPNYSTSPYNNVIKIHPVNILEDMDIIGGVSENWLTVTVPILLADDTGKYSPTIAYWSIKKSNRSVYGPRLDTNDAAQSTHPNNLYYDGVLNGRRFIAELTYDDLTYRCRSNAINYISNYPYLPTYGDDVAIFNVGNIDVYGEGTLFGITDPKEYDLSKVDGVQAIARNGIESIIGLDKDTNTISSAHINDSNDSTTGRYLGLDGLYVDGVRVAGLEILDTEGNPTNILQFHKVFFASPNGYCSGFAIVRNNTGYFISYFWLTDTGVVRIKMIYFITSANYNFIFRGKSGSLTKALEGTLMAVNWGARSHLTFVF